MPSYSCWLVDADLEPTYAYEKRVLKLLQWREPSRPWRLKCPTHLLFLDQLDTSFPDARFVWTHRDPAEVMPSVAEVYAEVGRMFTDELDLPYLAQLNVEHWTRGMQRATAFRDAGHGHRFFDLDFRAVQSDPIGEVRKLYAWLGEPVTPEFEAGMTAWWEANSAHRSVNERPDMSAYRLDVEAIRPLFADYTKRWA